MDTYIQPGKALTVTMPDATAEGLGVQVGTKLFGVTVGSYASGESGVIWTEGVFTLAKTTGQAYSAGDPVWWNATTKKVTSGTGANIEAGVVVETAGSSATTAKVKIGPVLGVNT